MSNRVLFKLSYSLPATHAFVERAKNRCIVVKKKELISIKKRGAKKQKKKLGSLGGSLEITGNCPNIEQALRDGLLPGYFEIRSLPIIVAYFRVPRTEAKWYTRNSRRTPPLFFITTV